MTIDEAIEILIIHNDHNPNFTDAQRNEAHQIGIEALKLYKSCGHPARCGMLTRLPGETEE